MKAHPGDHIVVAPVADGPVRDGEVIEARGPDGSPPFQVRWSDGHTALFYPGPGSVLRVVPARQAEDEAATVNPPKAAPAARGPEVREDRHHRVHDWQVRVSIFGSDDDTAAHAVLLSDSPAHLKASGHSHRARTDAPVPEVGDEVAVARALRRLADRLLETAAGDIEELTGEKDVTLRPR